MDLIKKNGAMVLISAFMLMAVAMDIIFIKGQKTSALMMFIICTGIFYISQKNIKLSKNTILLHLSYNILLLAITFKTRLYVVNILMLSYVLWYLITPYVIKYKLFYTLVLPLSLLSSYIITLFRINIPVLPFVLFPLYLLGYIMIDVNIYKVKKAFIFLMLNIMASSGLVLLFLYRSRDIFPTASLRLIALNSSPEISVYQPFWGMLLVWLSASFCLFSMYVFKKSKDVPSDNKSFETIYLKLLKGTLNFMGFLVFITTLVFMSEFGIRGSIMNTIKVISDTQIVFNLIFLSTIYMCLVALCGKVISSIITFLFVTVFTIANFIKFKFFDEPFYPWDTYIIKEGITISKEYVNLPVIISALIIFIVGFIILLIMNKGVRNFFRPKPVWKLWPFAIAMVLINGFLLNTPSQAAKVGIKKSWYIGKQEMLSNGLLVQNFMYFKNYEDYVLTQPAGYSKKKMQEISDRLSKEFPKQTVTKTPPNIVLVMCESFWDPTKLNGVKFNEDIMKGFNKYKKGEIVSPAIGGGTANVEFEALTGLTNYFLGPGVLAYNVYFRRDTPGLVSTLKDNGYDTLAIHPFNADMYNRNKVYKFMQFDKYISLTDFDQQTDRKGPYVSDDKLMDRVLKELSQGDKPKFIFALTMQNHDPYINKYRNLEVSATSDLLDEKEAGILSTYSEGVRDGSNSMDKLVKALKDSPTPTLVYFFGDHLPRMGTVNDMCEIYDRCNPEEDSFKKQFRTYTAPYASWSNYKETKTFKEPFSPAHIALEILKDSGVDYPSYFNILDGLKKENIYLQQQLSKSVDPDNQYIKDYEMIEYDIILGNQYLKSIK